MNKEFQEVETAMRALTEVHYGWGMAKTWNESGISVLFSGPPGSGKTMAAEVLAHKLDLPLFRIDLSQVVNKYIGETEKNLGAIAQLVKATPLDAALLDIAETAIYADAMAAADKPDTIGAGRLIARERRGRAGHILIEHVGDNGAYLDSFRSNPLRLVGISKEV